MNKDKKVFLIEPNCHGNGGWCGQTILGTFPLPTALKKYSRAWRDCSSSGADARVRICRVPDANKAIYFFNADEAQWEDKHGKAIVQFKIIEKVKAVVIKKSKKG